MRTAKENPRQTNQQIGERHKIGRPTVSNIRNVARSPDLLGRVFVGDFDDPAIIRMYATENASQRGNTSTAVTGSVASTARYLIKAILKGDQERLSQICESSHSLEQTRRLVDRRIAKELMPTKKENLPMKQTIEYQALEERFNNAWNEGAAPDHTENLDFMDEYDPELIARLYSDLLLTAWMNKSKAATLADYCEGRFLTLPTLDDLLERW
jgi:hypothetical protein